MIRSTSHPRPSSRDLYTAAEIRWYQPEERVPDVDRTVLLDVPGADEPIWLGYLADDGWYWVEGITVELPVAHWADLPAGPGGGQS